MQYVKISEGGPKRDKFKTKQLEIHIKTKGGKGKYL